MTLQDAHGEALSTAHASSVAAYDRALDLLNGLRLDPLAVLEPVLAEDPDFVSGHLLQAGVMLSAFDGQLLGAARAALDAAAAARPGGNERERSLHAALRPWAEGDVPQGCRRLERHLLDHPRDLLALQLAHLADLVLGQSTLLRDRIGRVRGHWSPEDAGWGHLLGMHAFGFEECGEYARAEDLGIEAAELEPWDAWAVHAVAHVHEMQGRTADGIAWLESTRPRWATDNALAVHNDWHLALMHLGRQDPATALEHYDRRVAPGPAALVPDLLDASSLLWRLMLRGVEPGGRWEALAARWREQASWGWSAFSDMHALMAFVGAGDAQGRAAALRTAHDMAARPQSGAEWREVAVPAFEALVAFGEGRYGRCVDLLVPVLPVSLRIGGSHAQRDVLHLTALEAARRAGLRAVEAGLAQERVQRRPDGAAPRRAQAAPALRSAA